MSEAQQTATPETEPSYKRAARLIREKFAALGILAVFRTPVPEVQPAPKSTPKEFHKPQPWPHVLFAVKFSRVYGSDRLREFVTEYRIGTGCAPWGNEAVKAHARRGWFSGAAQYVAERECMVGPGRYSSRRFLPEIEAEAAATACKLAKWAPDPAEIFATLCREGFDTRDVAFEDWAENFGYDTDSREAERIFEACQASWVNVLRLVSAADAEEFATLAGEL